MKSFEITDDALDDAANIYRHISEDSVEQANLVMLALAKTYQLIGDFPGLGRPYPNHGVHSRKYSSRGKLRNYAIFFVTTPNRTVIYQVVHGARHESALRTPPKP